MKRLVFTGFLVLFLTFPAFSLSFDALPSYQDEGMKLYVRGTGKLQEKNYVEAVSDLTRAVKLRPDIAEAFHNLGFAFERTGDLRNAARAYERALNLKPNYPSALNNLGYLLATSGSEAEKAVALCQKAVELQPNSASFQDSLGWALYKAGRHNEASEHFNVAIRLDPASFKSHFNLGLVEFSASNFVVAASHFRNAIQINSSYLKAYIPLADCYEKLNDDVKALHTYRQALTKVAEADPIKKHLERKVKQLTRESKQYYFSNVKKMQGSSKLQEFLERKGRTGGLSAQYNVASAQGDANTSFTPVSAAVEEPIIAAAPRASSFSSFQMEPVRSKVESVAARNERETSTLASSYSASSAYMQTSPRQISVSQERELERKYSLSKSYLDRGLVSEAENELSAIINTAPETSMVARQSRNLLLRVRKQMEEKNEQKAGTHRDMGKDFFRSGQYQMSEIEFNKALSLDPENAEVHKDLALLYYNQGRYQDAYEQSKKAIALNRTLKEAYVVLASLYARKGRPEDALRTLKMVREVSTRRDAVDELAEKMMASLSSEY
ncbi:MAG: tetratricopeptide repeat protein [Erysipelotrichia bacterium]|nr:tetratricopeptide repeat protein [Erysipelotrichia bacterium]